MKAIGKFILLDLNEFATWFDMQVIIRKISLVKQHHTFIPNYKSFDGTNHFKLCTSMENSHKERGFAEIAQNFTTFPDGKIMVCRNINFVPAGIKGANSFGICLEHVGNFDKDKDAITIKQKNCIISITKTLLSKFKLQPNENSVVYHHWYDLTLGKELQKKEPALPKLVPALIFFGGNTVADFKANFLPLLGGRFWPCVKFSLGAEVHQLNEMLIDTEMRRWLCTSAFQPQRVPNFPSRKNRLIEA